MESNRRSSRTTLRSKQLGQLLVENGDVTPEQIAQALKTQDVRGGMLGVILRSMGACTPEALERALLKQIQVADVLCEEIVVPPSVAGLLTKDYCLKEKLCPFERLGTVLCVVMANPLHHNAIVEVEGMTCLRVKAFKAAWPKIGELIERAHVKRPSGGAPVQPPRDEISLELDDDAPPPTKTASVAPPGHGTPPHDDVIIPPARPHDQPAAPVKRGFLDSPSVETIPIPSQANIPKPKFSPPPVEPKIAGLETLNSGQAELVTGRKRVPSGGQPVVKKAEPRTPQVNVDLDRFDHAGDAELIAAAPRENEALDEIAAGAVGQGAPQESGVVLVALKPVPDAYFYAGAAPKNAPRSDELLDVLEVLPVAEVVARSISEYEQILAGVEFSPGDSMRVASLSGSGMAGKSRVHLQRAPATPMAAVRLGEGEFQRLTLLLVGDEGGEWDWTYASSGPVVAEIFSE